ncbi:MAG TPA: cohesin domain-containing protein, partial [Vicinamibacterales bacterium]|nr:cohesin domain-containing protein [Vicinamibacterales bacterium]
VSRLAALLLGTATRHSTWCVHDNPGGSMRPLGALVAACLMMMLSASEARAAAITFSSVSVGDDLFDLSVFVIDAEDLYSYEFTVLFNSSLVSVQSVTQGDALVGSSFDSILLEPGELLTFSTLSQQASGQNTTGLLATFTVIAVGLGLDSISLADVILLNSLFDPTFPTDQNPGNILVMPSVPLVPDVTPIPEPSTLALLGLGLAGLARTRYRQRRR